MGYAVVCVWSSNIVSYMLYASNRSPISKRWYFNRNIEAESGFVADTSVQLGWKNEDNDALPEYAELPGRTILLQLNQKKHCNDRIRVQTALADYSHLDLTLYRIMKTANMITASKPRLEDLRPRT